MSAGREDEAPGFVHREERSARIQVAGAPAERHGGAAFVGGYVPPDDPALAPLRQCRDRRPADAFDSDVEYGFRMNGTYLYGGLLYDHFGHVMSEMVHRILTTRRHFSEHPWIFVGLAGGAPLLGQSDLPRAFADALEFLEVASEDVLGVHANATVENLQIAEQGSDFGGGPKPGYLQLLAAHANRRLYRLFPSGFFAERIFVSRSGRGPTGNLLGDRYIESLLEAEGWQVFHPERHSLAHQMQVYRRSKVAVFMEGSACHGLELLGENALEEAIMIERRPSHRSVFENVVRPRSRQYDRIEEAPLVGSAVPFENLAVYLHNTRALVDRLRSGGAATLARFDIAAYVEAARRDLDDYIRHFENDHMAPEGDPPARLRESFEAQARNL